MTKKQSLTESLDNAITDEMYKIFVLRQNGRRKMDKHTARLIQTIKARLAKEYTQGVKK